MVGDLKTRFFSLTGWGGGLIWVGGRSGGKGWHFCF